MATKYELYDRIKLMDGHDAIIKFIGKTTLNGTLWFGVEYLSSLISPFKPTLITTADIKSCNNKSSETSTQNPFNFRHKKRRNSTLSMNGIQYTNYCNHMSLMNPVFDSSKNDENNKLKFINPIAISKSLNIQSTTLIQDANNNKYALTIDANNESTTLIHHANSIHTNKSLLKRKICPYNTVDEYDNDSIDKGYGTNETNDSNDENINTQNIEPLYIKQILNIKSIFTYQKQLGIGGTCTVSLVTDKNNNKYALKELNKSIKYNEELFAREVQILQLLNDQKYILNYFGSYQTNDNYYLATNYCSGGTLLDHILNGNKFTETICKKYIYQILTAIEYMHNKNIIHRDLKLANIIFDTTDENAIVKIIDFGDCEIINDDEFYKEMVGTLYYLSPEYKRYRKGWELKKSDMWSIGVIAYIMLSGKLPFPANTQDETLKVIEKGVFEWPNNVKLSEECKDFINGLLCKSTEKRFGAKDALKHEWIA